MLPPDCSVVFATGPDAESNTDYDGLDEYWDMEEQDRGLEWFETWPEESR